MKKVEVINLPIRYNGKTYGKGERLEVEARYFVSYLMKEVGEVEKANPTFSVEEPIVLDKDVLEGLSIDELREYATKNNIMLGRSSSQEGIIEKIVKAQKK